VSETSALSARGKVEVRVRFACPVAPEKAKLSELTGVTLITSEDDGRFLEFTVSGNMDGLVKWLAAYPVATLETRQCGLEQVFHAHYSGKEKKASAISLS